MATINRTWLAQTFIEATSSTWTTLSGITEEYSADVDLDTNGYDRICIWPEVDFDATPTDDVDVKVYSSPDDGTSWDDTPFYTVRIDNGTDPSQLLIDLKDPPPYIRVGFVQTGSTNSHNVRCSFKAARWTSA